MVSVGLVALLQSGLVAQAQDASGNATNTPSPAPVLVAQNAPTTTSSNGQAASTSVETVVVSSTRISREGFVAPTPTTQITATDMQVGGPSSIASVLATVPGYTPSVSPGSTRSGVNANQATANLRDLGATRTLVLIDGARPVFTDPAGSAYGFDLNLIPTALIKRVDVVTGGASAQWGSDAVAGVINFVMDKDFDGLKLNVQDGGDFNGYASNEFKADIAAGTSFAGDRGHVVVGITFANSKGVFNPYRNPSDSSGIIGNPNFTATCGCAQNIYVQGLLNNNASVGGLIVSGPLKGTNFGPNGSISQFQYGQYGLLASSGSFMVGGDPSARLFATPPGQVADDGSLIVPQIRASLYGEGSYKLTDSITASVSVLFGHLYDYNPDFALSSNMGNITIANTYAYLPNSIVAAMAANGITSFTLGRQNEDFGAITDKIISNMQQYRVGLDGRIFGSWTWDAFYSYGQTFHGSTTGNQQITANFANSVNAVISPTTGQPVCAIALTTPTTNCVPVNLLGSGSVSAAARAYFLGASTVNFNFLQHEAALNVRGEPFSLWAGPVSVATGIEYRYEGIGVASDPLTTAKAFTFLNIGHETPSSYKVMEGYVETVVPLVRDVPMLEKVDLNAAIRESGYTTAGAIPSWKVGLTDNVTDDLLLRGTVSRDIRAPNLQELSFIGGASRPTVTNQLTGAPNSVLSFGGGNAALKAETADSWTVGATYHAGWLGNVNLSADYYSISVDNAIVQPTPQNLVNQCQLSNLASACAAITTSGNVITQIQTTFLNLATYKSDGLDIEADYNTDLSGLSLPGEVNLRWLATYVTLLKQYQGTLVTPIAGDVGQYGNRFRSTAVLNYVLDSVTTTARLRYIGGGAYSLLSTVNTRIPDVAYFDLGVEWRLPAEEWGLVRSGDFALYANMNNVFNSNSSPGLAAAAGQYDLLGRTYNVGIRVGL
jgi:outer membrane receptor protein involved in Fe transport